jgi:hypothetical protein
MASRKASPASAVKAATLNAPRATHLLTGQLEAGRKLLAAPPVEQLAFEGWQQTTRAVLVAAFGEPSDNVARFEEASPNYRAGLQQMSGSGLNTDATNSGRRWRQWKAASCSSAWDL